MASTPPLSRSSVLQRNPRVEFRSIEGEGGVLLHLDTAAYHGLNEVGAVIWSLLDGITFGDLLTRLRETFPEVPPEFESDIDEYVRSLVARDLVRVDPS